MGKYTFCCSTRFFLLIAITFSTEEKNLREEKRRVIFSIQPCLHRNRKLLLANILSNLANKKGIASRNLRSYSVVCKSRLGGSSMYFFIKRSSQATVETEALHRGCSCGGSNRGPRFFSCNPAGPLEQRLFSARRLAPQRVRSVGACMPRSATARRRIADTLAADSC